MEKSEKGGNERARARERGKGKGSSEREERRKGKEGGRENWEEKEEGERERQREVILGDGKDLLVIALPYGTLHGGGDLQSGMFTVFQYASTESSSTVQSTGYKVQGTKSRVLVLSTGY